MRFFVGITDRDWFDFLSSVDGLDEVFLATLSPDKGHFQGVLNGSGVVIIATMLPSA